MEDKEDFAATSNKRALDNENENESEINAHTPKRSKIVEENNNCDTTNSTNEQSIEDDAAAPSTSDGNDGNDESGENQNEEFMPVKIKAEPDDAEGEVACSNTEQVVIAPAVEIKREPTSDTANEADSKDNATLPPQRPQVTPTKRAIKVETAEAVSSTRESCKYGIRCYRRNPIHRQEMAHYGDPDYSMPDYPTPPLGTPNCPFGKHCYRRNPQHFTLYAHPPNTDFAKNYRMRLRKRKAKLNGTDNSGDNDDFDGSSSDDYDLDDPFIDDGDSEYVPTDDDEDDDEDDDGVDGRRTKSPAFFFTNNPNANQVNQINNNTDT